MNAIQVIRLLEDDGWVIKTQKGSHRQYIHAKKPGKITVAFHGKKEIPPWILNIILKQAGLK
jgi:predicted RNA binding protein YcfA (HicA-like mRNA interferase family)